MEFPSLNVILKYISLLLVVLGTVYVWMNRETYGLTKLLNLSSSEEDSDDEDDDESDDESDDDEDYEDDEDDNADAAEYNENEATTDDSAAGFQVQTPEYDYASLGQMASGTNNFENFDTFNHSIKF